MKHRLKILAILIFFSFASLSTQAQLTVKDFKLCLDNVKCTDTILLITKKELLESKKLIPNYSWFTIESAIVYFSEGEMMIANLPNNEFTEETRKKFERVRPGGIITIEVKGHNKQNVQVDWGALIIKIIDKH